MRMLMVLACGAVLQAQSFAPPLAGIVVDRDGHTERIFGIAGNLLPAASGGGDRVLSMAFSGFGGAVKTQAAVMLLDASGNAIAQFDAPPGHAVFGFDPQGRPALVWFRKTQQLFALSSAGLSALPSPAVPVAALNVDEAGTVQVASEGPALFVPGGALSASALTVTLRHTDGAVESIDIPAAVGRFERMGDGWVAVEAVGERYALRLSSPMRLFRIPETPQ